MCTMQTELNTIIVVAIILVVIFVSGFQCSWLLVLVSLTSGVVTAHHVVRHY